MGLVVEKSRSYSDDEIDQIFALARFHIENGNLKLAEPILRGLCDIRPDYAPGWLGACYLALISEQFESCATFARNALKCAPGSIEAQLFLISALLSLGDMSGAGTLLGEINDMFESGQILNPHFANFFKAQLGRYQLAR